MDFYQYYLRRLENRADKLMALNSVKDIALSLMDGPTPLALESGVGCLAALHAWPHSEGVVVEDAFQEVELALSACIYGIRAEVELTDTIWAHEANPEPPDGNCYPDDPIVDGINQVWGDEIPEGGQEEEAEGEAVMEVPRSHQPDFEHWETWTPDEWTKFQGYKDKMLAAASCSLSTMGMVTNCLAAVSMNLSRLPIPRRVEVAAWYEEVLDALYAHLEQSYIDICANSTLTREGRAVQKQMLTATTGTSENNPG